MIFNGYVAAPQGTIMLNGNSRFIGGLVANKLTMNGNAEITLLTK